MPSDLLSHRLPAFRDRHGLTQTDMAALLGVTPRYISALENGIKEVDPNTSLYRLFVAYEEGKIHVRSGHNGGVREEAASYKFDDRADSIGTVGGLSAQDALAQVRADLAMIEGGALTEKRRAYHFLTQVHLPLLAKVMKITP